MKVELFHEDDYRLINIDLRFDNERGVVKGATGRFHRSPSHYVSVSVAGLSLPFDEHLDWNALRDKLYALRRRGRQPGGSG